MKEKGTTAVVELLPAKGAQGQWVGVVDDSFGEVTHRMAVVYPTVTEIAVLSGGKREGLVKTANLTEKFPRYRQVIGSKETSPIVVGVVVGVEIAD